MHMQERIIFMGTPEFGAAILQELLDEKRNVVAVVSQPDKEVGRKKVLTASVVKKLALENNIDVLQPVRIRTDFQAVLDYQPDLIITCAYGQFIPDEVLNYPRLGCINVHASLLPKLRGGAPIQHSIIDGYKETGITIMEMGSKMDGGDIIAQRSCPIEEDDTYGSLHDKLIPIACELLRDTLDDILNGRYKAVRQDENEVTFGLNITKQEERLDLSQDYDLVYNHIRGLIPAPCAYFMVHGQKVKVWKVKSSNLQHQGVNGTLHFVNDSLGLVIDNRLILIEELQVEGKKQMSVKDFKNGLGREWEGLVAE